MSSFCTRGRDRCCAPPFLSPRLKAGGLQTVFSVKALIHDAVAQLFKDAGVSFERVSARGSRYSLAEEAYEEFLHWEDMPWE